MIFSTEEQTHSKSIGFVTSQAAFETPHAEMAIPARGDGQRRTRGF